MKRMAALLAALLLLCGCGAPAVQSAPPSAPSAEPTPLPLWTTAAAEELLASDAFAGSEMAPLDMEIAALLLGLEEDSITEGVYWMAANTSASADELLILVLTDEGAAEAALSACEARRDGQIKVCRDYCPAAVPRLEDAVISRRGNTLLYAVGDPDVLAGLTR